MSRSRGWWIAMRNRVNMNLEHIYWAMYASYKYEYIVVRCRSEYVGRGKRERKRVKCEQSGT